MLASDELQSHSSLDFVFHQNIQYFKLWKISYKPISREDSSYSYKLNVHASESTYINIFVC